MQEISFAVHSNLLRILVRLAYCEDSILDSAPLNEFFWSMLFWIRSASPLSNSCTFVAGEKLGLNRGGRRIHRPEFFSPYEAVDIHVLISTDIRGFIYSVIRNVRNLPLRLLPEFSFFIRIYDCTRKFDLLKAMPRFSHVINKTPI